MNPEWSRISPPPKKIIELAFLVTFVENKQWKIVNLSGIFLILKQKDFRDSPTNIYLFKINNINTRKKMRNMFRVNNKDTSLGTYFTPFSSVSIANFVFVCRVSYQRGNFPTITNPERSRIYSQKKIELAFLVNFEENKHSQNSSIYLEFSNLWMLWKHKDFGVPPTNVYLLQSQQ